MGVLLQVCVGVIETLGVGVDVGLDEQEADRLGLLVGVLLFVTVFDGVLDGVDVFVMLGVGVLVGLLLTDWEGVGGGTYLSTLKGILS